MLLCMMLVLSMIPSVAFAESGLTKITEVTITGMQEPVVGEAINLSTITINSTPADAYRIGYINWFNITDWTSNDKVFKEGKQYRLDINLTPKAGYTFGFTEGEFDYYSGNVTINGKTVNGMQSNMQDVLLVSSDSYYLCNHQNKEKQVVKATMSEYGMYETVCAECGKSLDFQFISAVKTVKLSTSTYTYDGKIKKPSVTVKDTDGKILKKDTDYTVTYASDRKAVGKYKVTVKGKSKYSFTEALYFKINPVKTSIISLTKGTKSFTVKWAKKTTQTTGYVIQYSTSSTFKAGTATKKVTITSNKTNSKTIKNLKAKKKYYVRVRTYKTVNGTKYYSPWSTKKYVTTK